MLKITQRDIKNLATNQKVFYRGMEYFDDGLVENFRVEAVTNTFRAVVCGGENYQVEVTWDDQGNIDDMFCECRAFVKYDGACKHIVAVLLKALNQDDEDRWLTLATPPTSPEPASTPGQTRPPLRPDPRLAVTAHLVATVTAGTICDSVKTPLQLKVTFYKDPLEYRRPPYLELELGTSRWYVVQKIETLLEAIVNHKELYFGKKFTYHPEQHFFLPRDRPLIEMMLEAYQDERSFFPNHGFSAFGGRYFTLGPSRCKKFLQLAAGLQHVVYRKYHQDQPGPLLVSSTLPPVSLYLKQTQKLVEMEFRRDFDILPITPDWDVLFMNGWFYIPSSDDVKLLAPILKSFSGVSSHTLPMADNDAARFILEAAPVLERICPVEIAPEISARLHQEPLTVSIWLDKYKEGISARLIFGYGAMEINPLAATGNNKSGGELLVREKGKEAHWRHILNEAGFEAMGEIYGLLDEARIFDFLRNILPKLTETAAVYYSEGFKSLQIRRSPRIRGGIRLDEQADLLEVALQFEAINEAELWEFIRALREKKKYFRLKDKGFIEIGNEETVAVAHLLEMLELTEKDLSRETITLPKYKAFSVHQAIREAGAEQFQVGDSLTRMIRETLEPQTLEFEPPEAMARTLRDYQKTGFKWLKTLSRYGFGGILADDMGLGKTLQVLALVQSGYEENPMPSLVIAPTSLVYNWQEEIEKFAPGLPAVVIDGSKQERMRLLSTARASALVLISYPLLRRDIEALENLRFAYCFIDEAQHIKNPETLNAKCVKRLKTRRRFAVTGTPIENTLTELWSVFDFVMPGYLGSHRKFQSKFETPIVKNNDQNALEDLGRYIRPFILRRLKKDVLTELPEKIETKLVCEMTEEQRKVYAAYLIQARSEFEEEVSARGFEKSRLKVLALLMRLRQICCHPALFLENYADGSGKLELLRELVVDSLAGGHRLLIFSQFVSMLDMMEEELKADGRISYRIDGQTPSEERMKRVHAFNAGAGEVFLISLKAGGTGLNLTGADTVIHFDPWWNPAVEDQATDRAYRIGQHKAVQVYKLVTRGTIEEKIFTLQQRKKELVDAVIQSGETFIGKMAPEEIRALFYQ